MVTVPTGSTITLDFLILNGNVGVTGQSPSVLLQRQSDGAYWTGTGFSGTLTKLPLTELDSVNQKGLYSIQFNQGTQDSGDQAYRAYFSNSGTYAQDMIQDFVFNSVGNNLSAMAIAQITTAKILQNPSIPINSSDIASQATLLATQTTVNSINSNMATSAALTSFSTTALSDLNNIISILTPLSGANQITFILTDPSANPIPNIGITIKNQTSQITLSFGQTDSNGRCVFPLPNGIFNVLFYLPFYNFGTQPYVLTVSGNATINITGTSFRPSAPSPNLCTIFSYLNDLTGTPIANVLVRAKAVTNFPFSQPGSSTLLTKDWVEATTDLSGFWSLNVAQGATIEISIPQAYISITEYTIPIGTTSLDLTSVFGTLNN